MSVASPCDGTCRFSRGTCVACLRTKEEARRWGKMTDVERRRVLAERKRRVARIER